MHNSQGSPPHNSLSRLQIKVCLPQGDEDVCKSTLNDFRNTFEKKHIKYECVIRSRDACIEAVANGELDFAVFGGEAKVVAAVA